MKAAVFYSVERPVVLEEVQLKDPGPGEVRVALKAAGLCHSDLSVIDGTIPYPVPVVPLSCVRFFLPSCRDTIAQNDKACICGQVARSEQNHPRVNPVRGSPPLGPFGARKRGRDL